MKSYINKETMKMDKNRRNFKMSMYVTIQPSKAKWGNLPKALKDTIWPSKFENTGLNETSLPASCGP